MSMGGIQFIIPAAIIIAAGIYIGRRIAIGYKQKKRQKKAKNVAGKIVEITNQMHTRFLEDEEYRKEYASDPKKMSAFFVITDMLCHTDFTRGLKREPLVRLFESNPEVMESRIQEFLQYMNKKKERIYHEQK